MTKNQCLESLKRLSEAVESFAASCGLEDVNLDLKQRAGDLSYKVSNWLIGEEVAARLDAASRRTAECTLRVEEMKRRLKEQQQLLDEQENRFKEEQERTERMAGQLAAAEASLKAAVSGIITMRDSLLTRVDLLRENGVAENDERFKVVSISLRETAALLGRMGVTIVEDEGLFDPARQTIAETIPTSDPGLANHIARVFRPGYLYQGEVLRGQEVIIYVKD